MIQQLESIEALEKQIEELKKKLYELKRTQPPTPVEDFILKDTTGQEVRLSTLFGDKDDLLTVHNMGQGCPYCTLWADGFNSISHYLESRAGFVLVSGDDPETAAAFSRSKGWRFKVLSGKGSRFSTELGFYREGQGCLPGVTSFHRQPDGSIVKIASSYFGPGDDFCSVWFFFDLLKEGPNGWEPQMATHAR